MSELNHIALKIISNGKGILAADESTPSMNKKFDAIGVTSTSENRLKYREILFSSDGMKDYIGGVILFEETLNQISSSGLPIPRLIENQGTLIGIKVDTGLKKNPESLEENITSGLEGLAERLKEYYSIGARFTKWRALIKISDKLPTEAAIKSNAIDLAKYASIVQKSNMVPIVEPEVLMEGYHNINKCYEITTRLLSECFNQLKLQNVDLSGMLLKPNMVVPGINCKDKTSINDLLRD